MQHPNLKEYCEQLLSAAAESPSGLVVLIEGDGALVRAITIRRLCYKIRKDRNLMLKLKQHGSGVELHIIPPGGEDA